VVRFGVLTRAAGRHPEHGGIVFKLLFLIFLVCFLFMIYLVRHPLLRLAGGFWVVDDGPAYSDAIVILGDDDYGGDRAAKAAELFKAGWAPRVVASGRFLRPYASITDLEEHDLKGDGVPEQAIVRFQHHAENTKEEAEALRQLIRQQGWKRILVVTSNYHTRRARYICARMFPSGTVLRVVPAHDSEYDPDDWWQTRRGLVIFSHEFVGMIVAMWEMRRYDVQTVDSAVLVVHSVMGYARYSGIDPVYRVMMAVL
jgi:uncharacterized SAM-binding protein YcdF (DUF218 family)